MTSKTVKLSDIIIPKFHTLVNDHEHVHQILTSGRAGTKSSFMAILVDFLLVSDPHAAAIVMRKHHNKLRKTVFNECQRAIKRLGLSKSLFKITKSPMQITYRRTGSTVYFTGSDSIDDTKGMIDDENTIKMVVLDELTEFFDKGDGEDEISNIVATFVRGNDEDFRMLYLYNPPKNPKAPINEWCQKMEMRPDCVHVHVTYQDVPVNWLGKRLIEEAKAMKAADLKMYRWVWLGEAVGLDDLIYYMFDPDRHVREPAKDQNISIIGIGVDYGQMNPTTFQPFGLDFTAKKMVGLSEYYYCGRTSGHQKSPGDYARDFREFIDKLYQRYGQKPVFCFIDPSAKGLQEEIRRLCPEVQFPSVDNTVSLGISRVQKLLIYDVLQFCSAQKELQGEMYLYSYDPDSIERGEEKPIKQNDHCCDAVRYAVMGLWNYIVSMLPILRKE